MNVSWDSPTSPRPFSTAIAALATASVVAGTLAAATSLSTGTASADPCDTYRPSLGDQLAASSLGESLGSGSSAPSWLTGHPEGLPQLSGNTQAMNFLTGPNSPDTLRMKGLNSTDLGIMWDAGDSRVLAAFGDSFTCGANSDGWHSNSLFQTHDENPSNGIFLEGPATGSRSEEFLPRSLKIDNVEMTIIPTAGIEVNGAQHVDFMSVKHWGNPGSWTTNYAQTAKSTDGGKTWSVVPNSMRTNTSASNDSRLPTLVAHQPGAENFQMTAFAKTPSADGFVYVYGTPNGRSGQARLARIPEASFPTWSAAEFWDGSSWSSSMSRATPVIDGRVSELSVMYNDQIEAWLALYETTEGIVIRKADSPEGPWSDKHTLVSRTQVPDLYGGYMFPHQVNNSLYWVGTSWAQYNAVVFKTDLNAVF